MASCVYFAEFKDLAGNVYLKVGKANNPLQRLPHLQVACPFELSRLRHIALGSEAAAYKAERAVQAALESKHLRGEWFYAAANDEPALLAFDVVPVEVVSAVVKASVRVNSLSMVAYARARKLYESLYGSPASRKGGSKRRKVKELDPSVV